MLPVAFRVGIVADMASLSAEKVIKAVKLSGELKEATQDMNSSFMNTVGLVQTLRDKASEIDNQLSSSQNSADEQKYIDSYVTSTKERSQQLQEDLSASLAEQYGLQDERTASTILTTALLIKKRVESGESLVLYDFTNPGSGYMSEIGLLVKNALEDKKHSSREALFGLVSSFSNLGPGWHGYSP